MARNRCYNRLGQVKRREFLKTLSASAALLGLESLAADTAPAAKRPNVLYVFSDMQRAYSMGCYGNAHARTPVLDQFATQGARFDAAMSNTPVCCPHRASLMSGQYAHHHGMLTNGAAFLPKVKCLAETFRDAGYTTAYVGKWHLDFPREGGQTRRFGFPAVGEKYAHYIASHDVKPCADKMIDYLRDLCASDRPWFCMLSWLPPHSPYRASPGYAEHFKDAKPPPNVPADLPQAYAKKNLPDYYGMIEEVDAEFGRVLAALDQAGVAEDTIVVYSSDHGDMLGSHGYTAKRWPYEDSARVPLLIRYPRRIQPGQVITDPIGTPDLYPTLAGLAGLHAPEGLDGLDFSRRITENAPAPRDHVYLEMAYAYVPWPGWRALRTRQHAYARTADGPWLLHDIEKDPFQLHNLVDDPAAISLVQEMDQRLLAAMQKTGDSWDKKAASGDLRHWKPGGPKQRSTYLGVTWPGCAVTDETLGKKKRKLSSLATLPEEDVDE